MKRTLINVLCAGAIAVGTGYLTTDAYAGAAEYNACMSWCTKDYEFMTCHGVCKEYLVPVATAPS